ncbi:MAG: transmembrane Fragile-X-F protein [Lachnospiraceae bacterium]|nr:transmembrane Fragile-X-F protein [Lachnospiraceae bacterium]
MGFTEILTIIFVVLKCFGLISWSWWLVLLPELIAFALYLLLIVHAIYTYYQVAKEAKKFRKSFFDDLMKH